MKYFNYTLLTFIALSLFACTKPQLKDDNSDNSEQEQVLNNYNFVKDGGSTVDFGESIEIIKNFKYLNDKINSKSGTGVGGYLDYYKEHLESHVALTSTQEKQTEIRNDIEAMFTELANISQSVSQSNVAAPGKAGYVQVATSEFELLNAKGVVIGQLIQKSLMGVLQLDNIYYYINKALSADNTLVEGKNYTNREHYWDIAYGFVGRPIAGANRPEPLFLANYIEKEAVGMKGLEGIDINIYKAFYDGRKAISNNDMAKAKLEADKLRTYFKNLLFLRAKYYLNQSQELISKFGTQNSAYFHNMSEALGFILSLGIVQNTQGQQYTTYSNMNALYQSFVNTDTGVWDTELMSSDEAGSISNGIKELNKIFR